MRQLTFQPLHINFTAQMTTDILIVVNTYKLADTSVISRTSTAAETSISLYFYYFNSSAVCSTTSIVHKQIWQLH